MRAGWVSRVSVFVVFIGAAAGIAIAQERLARCRPNEPDTWRSTDFSPKKRKKRFNSLRAWCFLSALRNRL